MSDKLKSLLGDDLYKEFKVKIPENQKFIFDLYEKEPNYVPKSEFDKKSEDLNSFKTKLNELEKNKNNSEDLSKTIQQLQNDLTKKDGDFLNYKKDTILESALKESKAKNTKAVKALLDMDQLKFENDKFTNLKDLITPLLESDPYLFDIEEQTKEVEKEAPANQTQPKWGNHFSANNSINASGQTETETWKSVFSEKQETNPIKTNGNERK